MPEMRAQLFLPGVGLMSGKSSVVKVTCLRTYVDLDGSSLLFKGRCWTDPEIAERAVNEGYAVYGWEEEQSQGAAS